MLEQREISIGDQSYLIQQFTVTVALEVGVALTKIIAGAADGVGDMEPGSDLLDVWISPGKLAAGVMSKLDVQGTPQLVKRMVAESQVKPDYSSEWYEVEFAGRFDDLMTYLTAVIDLNRYGDLLKKAIPELMAILPSDTNTEG